MTAKRWNVFVLVIVVLLLVMIALPTIYVDPFFHYHKPYGAYILDSERYQNDGIVKHFEYDALITGTSMTENFKTSEFDELFGVHSIKVPFWGATYKEINECVEKAIAHNPNIKIILRGLDLNKVDDDKDRMRYDVSTYPTYLYDNNIANDVKYVLNKAVLLKDTYSCIRRTLLNEESDTFDDYVRWANDDIEYGKKVVIENYNRPAYSAKTVELTEVDKQRIIDNVDQNILKVAKDNPDITFYYFLTPYSVVWWDSLKQEGKLDYTIEAQRIMIEQILQYDNIKLFSWCDEISLVSDLDQYKDTLHYSDTVNSQMLTWMLTGKGELTLDNYEDYLIRISEFYSNYNYNALFDAELK